MEFKKGQRVRLVGHENWCATIRRDIGLIGTVEHIMYYNNGKVMYVGVKMHNSKSGNFCWNVTNGDGIELAKGQMVFPFMYK